MRDAWHFGLWPDAGRWLWRVLGDLQGIQDGRINTVLLDRLFRASSLARGSSGGDDRLISGKVEVWIGSRASVCGEMAISLA